MHIENVRQRLEKWGSISVKPTMRRAIAGAVMLLSFGYLGWILARNWGSLVAYDWQVDLRQVALAFVCYSVALGLAVVGWSLIMRHLTPMTHMSRHLKYYTYTNLLKRLPGPLLNVLGRAYFYGQEGIAKPLTVTISLLEWAVIVLSGLLVYLVTSPFMPIPRAWRSPLIPGAVLLIGMLLIRPKTFRAALRLFGQDGLPISFRYTDLFLWLIVYSLVWIAGGVVLYVGINSIYSLPLRHLPAVVGIWVASGIIPTLMLIIPMGFGLKELTLSFLLGHLMPAPLAVVVALLMRLGLTLFEIIWGLVAFSL